MWPLLALTVVIVLGVAFYSVFRVSARLSNTEALSIYDPKEAANYIMENLPPSLELERYEVEFLVGSHLDYLRASGIANQGAADLVAVDMAHKTPNPLADENELLDFVFKQLSETEFEISDIGVTVVLDLSMQYLVKVGAVGKRVE